MFSLAALSTTEFFVLAFVLGVVPFWILPLVDAIRTPADVPFRHGSKTMWVLLIALTGLVGGVLYYALGRPERSARVTAARG